MQTLSDPSFFVTMTRWLLHLLTPFDYSQPPHLFVLLFQWHNISFWHSVGSLSDRIGIGQIDG